MSRGFSLVELLAVLAVFGLLVVVAVPAGLRFYETTRERQAIRETMQVLAAARERSLLRARIVDVRIHPRDGYIASGNKRYSYPSGVNVLGRGSRELNDEDAAVIRFYPDGSTSGGGVDVIRSSGATTAIDVDWLLGRITQSQVAESS